MSADDLDPGVLAELLEAPDRDRAFATRPVVSFHEDDDPVYLDELRRRGATELELMRRGVYHGRWAEFAPSKASSAAPRDDSDLGRRWHAARPIVLPGFLGSLVEELGERLADALAEHETLREPGGLRAWLTQADELLAPDFCPLDRDAPLVDSERDIERVLLASEPPSGAGRTVDDLWLKTGWLSTHDDDASLRLRFSFGREIDDDASPDLLRHRLVAELAARLLPEARAIAQHAELGRLLRRLTGETPFFTQHIAYWNAPDGGALFHHDAFADSDGGPGGPLDLQLGVCFVQLVGRTAWLALSIDDLADRVSELVGYLAEGELGWVRARLVEGPLGWKGLVRLVADREALLRELSLPGCGRLAALVNQGPEFTGLCADAGHAAVLDAGDVLLLPNHGLKRTAMHSVFCASDELTYALSLAIRSTRPPPEPPVPEGVEVRGGVPSRLRALRRRQGP